MSESKCPFHVTATGGGTPTNHDWWPNQLNLKVLIQYAPETSHRQEGVAPRMDSLEAPREERIEHEVPALKPAAVVPAPP